MICRCCCVNQGNVTVILCPELGLLRNCGQHCEDLDLLIGSPDQVSASSEVDGYMSSPWGLCLLCRDGWAGSALPGSAFPILHTASLLLLGPALSTAKTMPSPSLQVPHWMLSLPHLCPTLDRLKVFLLLLGWYRFDQFPIEIKGSQNMKKSTKLNLNKRYRVGFSQAKHLSRLIKPQISIYNILLNCLPRPWRKNKVKQMSC